MPYDAAASPSVGEATKKTLIDKIIANQTYFNSMIGTSAIGASLVPNGSFEDVTGGVPDGWTATSDSGTTRIADGTGGTTSPSHGDTAYEFVSAGAPGGGFIQTTDAFPVSEGKQVTVDFLLYSSVADIHNLVEIRWYSGPSVEGDFISATAVYDDATTNPVTTWTRFVGSATPATGALWATVRLTGAKNDDATPGTCAFDGVVVTESIVQMVVGHDAGTLGDGNYLSRIYFDTTIKVNASAADVIPTGYSYVEADVAGGVTITVKASEDGTMKFETDLVLPIGLWTIYVTADGVGGSGNVGYGTLSAIATRQY